MLKRIKTLPFTDWVLLLSLLAVGSFHEYISCALSVVLCARLLLLRSKKLTVRRDLRALAVAAVCLGYGLTCLWAVDRGMALIGFAKFLPAGLYLLCLWQEERESKVLSLLPYVGAVMAAVSTIGMQIPALKSLFSVADRLAGFFQYPNTFAVFLLVCQLLLLKKQKKAWWDYGVILVLLAGILYSGSRTVFVVAALSNLLMLFAVSKKRGRAILLALGAAACVTAAIFAFNENSVIGRYLRFSLTESTLVGRVLYVADALPLLLKYPFGMGYMGYYYVQQSVQTGVYSVAFIHNDFLQLFLDIGWIPALLFLWMLGAWFFRKTVPVADKIAVGALCLHCLFDFDLQFVGIFLLLLHMTDPGTSQKTAVLKTGLVFRAAAGTLAAVSLYLGTALGLSFAGQHTLSDALYPANTANKLTMLEQVTEVSEANRLSDEILKTNTCYFAPYSMKAKYAYSQGDFASLIQYKQKVFAANPFAYEEYEEYCQMLINGIMLYERAGDAASADVCRRELIATAERLRGNEDRLSTLGRLITDQPVTELSEDVRAYISRLEEDAQ